MTYQVLRIDLKTNFGITTNNGRKYNHSGKLNKARNILNRSGEITAHNDICRESKRPTDNPSFEKFQRHSAGDVLSIVLEFLCLTILDVSTIA